MKSQTINQERPKTYHAAWYWHLLGWLGAGIGAALAVHVIADDHVTSGSRAVIGILAAMFLFYGAGTAFVSCRYRIGVKGRELIYEVRPFTNKVYPLTGVKDVSINGPYLVIDYGQIPRPVIFLLNGDRLALFSEIAEVAHNLPPGSFSEHFGRG